MGLWTKPADVRGFEREYRREHFPKLDRLENALDSTVAHCLDGAYYQVVEVSFTSLDDMYSALDTELGKHVLDSAQQLADKFGIQVDVLVVDEPA
ncbi:MAG TPA: hypothetical protein VF743_12170 [Acidimicrobiales bacterium]